MRRARRTRWSWAWISAIPSRFDPAREAQYTPPLTLTAAYESLVTMTPGDYLNVKPALATAWARTPDGKGWRFTLRDGAKFNSGNPVTVEDVKWIDRAGDQRQGPAIAISSPMSIRSTIVDPHTVDVIAEGSGRSRC